MRVFSHNEAMETLSWLESNTPLIHCLTNSVAVNFTANALLAIGASPAMVEAWQEVPTFTQIADNLLINIGTLDETCMKSMTLAAQTAKNLDKPWVFDPTAVCETLAFRSDFAHKLLAYNPKVIRGNPSEILFLAGEKSQNRGVDSLSQASDAITAAIRLAKHQRCVIAVTGEVDHITDGNEVLLVPGGHIRLTKVTATGCVLSALCAATVLCGNTLYGVATACYWMKQAGARAARRHNAMGSFATALLDELTPPWCI